MWFNILYHKQKIVAREHVNSVAKLVILHERLAKKEVYSLVRNIF